MNYLLSSLIGYILGSFPTAYVILQKAKGIDITQNGSGNVGAMNSYEVTNSKVIGSLVFLIDALKGLLSVYIALLIYPGEFSLPAIALIFAVLSHCFNPWLGFKGGRGLATALGGTILIFPVLPIVWCTIWIIVFVLKRDIILANLLAIISSAILLFLFDNISLRYSFPHADSISSVVFFISILLIIIFIKHIDPLNELMRNYKSSRNKDV